MAVRLDKPWRRLDSAAVAALTGQLGVYQLSDDGRAVRAIVRVDARSLFGLRGALSRELAERGKGLFFRLEITHQPRTRWLELMMAHRADHGRLPDWNPPEDGQGLGRLSPA